MSRRLNIQQGQRFGRFVIIEEAEPNDKYKKRNMLVRCDCGTVKTVHLTAMMSGGTVSCGCIMVRPRRTDEPPAVDGCRWVAVYPDKWALVDESDFPRVSSVLWRRHSRYAATKTETNNSRGFMNELMHRFMFKDEIPKGLFVDHINGNGLDNRRVNIRFATRQQNGHNSRPPKNRRFKGAHRCRNHWQAEIRHNGVLHRLGMFKTEIEAARVYNEAAKRLFGEYAWLNAVDDNEDGNDAVH